MKKQSRILMLVVALAMVFGFATASPAILANVGPVDGTNGFPLWVTDQNGLSLALCKDPADPLCLADPVIGGNAFSALIGFGAEAFWWLGEALMDVAPGGALPTGGQALLVLAVEAAFADDVVGPAQGDQIGFSRLRIRIDAPVVGLYTVTHPYGTDVFNVLTPGVRAINSEVGAPHVAGDNLLTMGDVGCDPLALPCDFTLLLGGGIGPYLTAVNPAPPAGYIGQPLVDQTVTGSPFGTNIFRVDGPTGSNLGGPGIDFIQTDLFALQGKIQTFNADILALVTEYYNDILGRAPELGAAEAWTAGIERITGLGIDIKEGFIVLAKVFFSSVEYMGRGRTDTQYVTDLYQTFLDRAPDAGGQAFWEGLLGGGLSREVVLNFFAFSAEFDTLLSGIFGVGPGTRPENNLTNDLYRGILSRLADSAGFGFWLDAMRAAQCVDAASVQGVASQLASLFTEGAEYAGRGRTDAEYLADLYDGIMRRGAFQSEIDGWLALMTGGMTRAQVLALFINAPEYQGRVQNIIDAGCLVP